MKILITAGGTGGHIMPALAIAAALRAADPATRILFVGTDRGLEERAATAAGLDFIALPARGLKGKPIAELLPAVRVNLQALYRALKIVRDFAPDRVVGTGGYVTGMVVLAARLRGVRCAIQEQNARPGLTNRVLARLVARIYLAFPDREGTFPPAKTLVCGNPLRGGLEKDGPHDALLVMGGSLGATSINNAAAQAVAICRDQGLSLPVIHQTGAKDEQTVRQAYQVNAIPAEVAAFFDDMASVYKRCRLVVCRAGGVSLSELSRLGIPAIMVPFPLAADDHQSANAHYISDQGGGWIIPDRDLTPGRLAHEIAARLADEAGLQQAATRIQNLHLGDGAEIMAQELLSV